jgi:hypothetical protein
MRAEALRSQPNESLIEADEAIRVAVSPELAAVGFELVGRVYYDQQNDLWARRLFAFSELMSPALLVTFPDVLLWGAEAALWRGHFARSRASFERLRVLLSDREYGADVEFRLLGFDLLAEGGKDASSGSVIGRIEHLRTHYVSSHIAADVLTLDFCRTAEGLGARARRVEYERTRKAIGNARLDLREQALACLLDADLEEARANSQSKAQGQKPGGQQVRADAAAQAKLIQAFEEEFPDSPYAVLFKERQQVVGLGEAFGLLADNDCPRAMEFYEKNTKALLATQGNGAKPVAGLNWSATESQKLNRCIAAHNRIDLWDKLPGSIRGTGQPLRDAFFVWRKKQTSANLVKLQQALVAETGWTVFDDTQERIDSLDRSALDDAKFWRFLAVREVLAAEPQEPRDSFYDAPLEAVIKAEKAPQPPLGSSQMCLWAQQSLRVDGDALKSRLQSFSRSGWLERVSIKAGLTLGDPNLCQTRLAALVVGIVTSKPSQWSDDEILWPYIEKIGPLSRQDVAFDLAVRTFENSGEVSDRVFEVVSKIAKEGKEPDVRNTAKNWIRDHVLQQKRGVW